jgi:hypothetical protein
MTKSKTGVKASKSAPTPKQSGVIRQTKEWAKVVSQMEDGKSIEIRLPEHFNGSIRHPINAFMAAMKRKYRKTYRIYARNGTIYALPKDT